VTSHGPGAQELDGPAVYAYRLGLGLLSDVLQTHIVGLFCQDDDGRVHVVAPGENPLPLMQALEGMDWKAARRIAEEFSQ